MTVFIDSAIKGVKLLVYLFCYDVHYSGGSGKSIQKLKVEMHHFAHIGLLIGHRCDVKIIANIK